MFVIRSGIDTSTAETEIKELETRKHCLEAFIEELTLNNTAASMISQEMIFDLINKSKEFVLEKNISECRGFIESYIEKVLLYNDKIEVFFKIYIPNAEGNAIVPLKSEADKTVLQETYSI